MTPRAASASEDYHVPPRAANRICRRCYRRTLQVAWGSNSLIAGSLCRSLPRKGLIFPSPGAAPWFQGSGGLQGLCALQVAWGVQLPECRVPCCHVAPKASDQLYCRYVLQVARGCRRPQLVHQVRQVRCPRPQSAHRSGRSGTRARNWCIRSGRAGAHRRRGSGQVRFPQALFRRGHRQVRCVPSGS